MGGLTPEYLQKLTQNQGPAQGFMASMQEKQSQKKLDAKEKQDLFRAMAAKYQLKEGVEPPKGFEGMEEIVGMFDTSKADKQDLLPTVTFDPLKGKFFKTDKETGQQVEVTEVPKFSPVRNLNISEHTAGVQLKKQRFQKFDQSVREQFGALAAINRVDEASKALPESKIGILNQLMAKGELAVGSAAADPDIAMYTASVDAALGAIARGPMVERGVLTNQDLDRARNAIGNKTLPLHIKLRILDRLREQVSDNVAVNAEISKVDIGDIKSGLPLLYGYLGGDTWASKILYKKSKVSTESPIDKLKKITGKTNTGKYIIRGR